MPVTQCPKAGNPNRRCRQCSRHKKASGNHHISTGSLHQPILFPTMIIITALTARERGFMIAPLSQNVKDWIRTPAKTGHNRPLSNVVFLCPPKTQAALCRVYSVMAGCIEQPLKRLAGSCTGSANLIHSATQRLAPMGGGYPLYTGATA